MTPSIDSYAHSASSTRASDAGSDLSKASSSSLARPNQHRSNTDIDWAYIRVVTDVDKDISALLDHENHPQMRPCTLVGFDQSTNFGEKIKVLVYSHSDWKLRSGLVFKDTLQFIAGTSKDCGSNRFGSVFKTKRYRDALQSDDISPAYRATLKGYYNIRKKYNLYSSATDLK